MISNQNEMDYHKLMNKSFLQESMDTWLTILAVSLESLPDEPMRLAGDSPWEVSQICETDLGLQFLYAE